MAGGECTGYEVSLGIAQQDLHCLLVWQQVQAGTLQLDTPVTVYLPWYRQDTGNRVTVRHLLNHTSGIPDFLTPEFVADAPYMRPVGVKEFAVERCTGDLQSEPGSRFAYNNCGYSLLGAILESASGKPYAQLLRENILTPP